MERVKKVWLLLSSLGSVSLAWLAVSPGSGEYKESKYSIYPAPGTYTIKVEAAGFCSSTCRVLVLYGKRIRVDDPRSLLRERGFGTAKLSVDGYNRPTLVGWQE